MTDTWTDRWDERYGSNGFAYGGAPNDYLREQLEKLPPGNILFPAEGEGRNAVYAATLGWSAYAFDISMEGQKKAVQLTQKNKVVINYQVDELQALGYQQEAVDVIALIYAHFPAAVKSQLHQTLSQYLRKGGMIIFEAFSKNHLNYLVKNAKVGGPKDIKSLFSVDESKADFSNYDIIELEEKEIHLNEGIYHNGLGSVIRFVGSKN